VIHLHSLRLLPSQLHKSYRLVNSALYLFHATFTTDQAGRLSGALTLLNVVAKTSGRSLGSCFLLPFMTGQAGRLSGALMLLSVVAASGQKLQGNLWGAVSCCVL